MSNNELKRIEALHGPFAGGVIDVPADIADAGIADGWARDPHATPDPDAEPKEFDYEAVMEAANKAARKIRGEDEADDKAKAKPAAKSEDKNADTQAAVGDIRERQMEAGKTDTGYETRTTTAKPTTAKKK